MNLPNKVLITGANGFIGRALTQRLQQLGVQVVGVDLQADSARNIYAGSVDRAGDWQQHAKGCELLFHTAAVVSNTATPALYRSVTVGSVRHLIDAAVQADASRLIHVSSIAAYGLDFQNDRNETADISLLSGHPYCDAKAASEHAALAAHAAGEMGCTIIRPGDVYGPGSRPWVTIPLELMRKNQFLLPMQGKGVFSPVYIENLLDGTLAAAFNSQAAGQIYNITDGQAVSCLDFFSHHWRWAGKKGQPICLNTGLAQGITKTSEWLLNTVLKQNTEISSSSLAMLTRRATYSIGKAQQQLDYAPKVDLPTGMQLTEQWLRAQKMI